MILIPYWAMNTENERVKELVLFISKLLLICGVIPVQIFFSKKSINPFKIDILTIITLTFVFIVFLVMTGDYAQELWTIIGFIVFGLVIIASFLSEKSEEEKIKLTWKEKKEKWKLIGIGFLKKLFWLVKWGIIIVLIVDFYKTVGVGICIVVGLQVYTLYKIRNLEKK